MNHFSLFTGIGGIDLSAEWAGFTSVGQCELADYPYKVLCKHWPDVPKWRDIRDVTNESVRAAGIERITVLSGGFPCQPFSVAGKRAGKADDRDLWPQMFRIIHELQPRWVLGENVIGFVNMELDRTIFNLENEGYEVQPFIIPACSVQAPHERKRVFIVAHSRCALRQGGVVGKSHENENRDRDAHILKRSSGTSEYYVANADSERLQAQRITERLREKEGETRSGFKRGSLLGEKWNTTRWEPEPAVGRVANGIPNRVDRLKCLGNAVVPQQVYPILKAIYEIERCNQ
ncbi:MAG: DNA cytosine methyltransferase [Candidatus Humimicrobiaceae bacterium]